MSNSLIPYSFTPGTKAKAQEVNANFIALSEKIEENRAFTTTQIADTLEKLNQANIKTESDKADVNLGNTTLISNCIIEAPNGVVTVAENVITVKKGLKVLIPDGFNEDGTTKSIIHEIADDISVTTVKNTYINCIYVTPDGCNHAQKYLSSEVSPFDARGIWYCPSKNKSYLYNADTLTWDEIKAVVIALFENTGNTAVLKEVEKPVRLFTYSDRIGIMNMFMPDYTKRVGRSWNVRYTATVNGWVHVFSSGQCDHWSTIYINNIGYNLNWVRYGDQASSAIMIPIKRGDNYLTTGESLNGCVYFIPMEGDM